MNLVSRPIAAPRNAGGFTLIELLIVISIIAILAALSFAAVNGALKSGRKAEVRSMANQIKLAIESYYAEYGFYPSATTTDANLLTTLSGGTNVPSNPRGIRFIEIAPKFTNNSGIVTPLRFYPTGQSNFAVRIDTNFSGSITAPDGTTIRQTVAVGVTDPDRTNTWLGTWK